MSTLLKNLGIALVLLGVLCFAIYNFGAPYNALLVVGLALEVSGLFTYIICNKFIQ
jgi:hypothetical protein